MASPNNNPPSTPAQPTATQRLYRIVEDGMCIGCGLCQSVAGPGRIRMGITANGNQRPIAVDELDHEIVERIYDVCPGTRLEGLPQNLIDDNTEQDLVWGAYQRMVLGHASDPEVRFRGSTGGVLTALGQFLIASQRVEFIVHARASKSEPTFGERAISCTIEDVLSSAGSRYGPTAPLIDICEILERGRPFAFIGKPCDIAALRNLALFDERVNKCVKYWLTPVCGGFMPPEGMKRFLAGNNFDESEIVGFRYRGYGCPGPTRIEFNSRPAKELHYLDFWGEDESKWSLPFRCKVCPDGIGEAADIAAADTWPGGSPDRSNATDNDPGTNAIIIRTTAGMELVKAAINDGWLTLGNDVDPRYMDNVQPHQVKKKYAARARWNGLLAEGRTTPRSARLRLDALAKANGQEANQLETAGTRRRIREGKTCEPTPVAHIKDGSNDGTPGE